MRNYKSTVTARTLSAAITGTTDTSIYLTDTSGLPTYPFTLVIDPDTVNEEIVTVTAAGGGTGQLTVTRGQDGTTAKTHTITTGAVRHMITARDLQEPQDHIAATSAHGTTSAIVGKDDTQTLTAKTLTSPVINTPAVTGGTITGSTISGGTISGSVTNSGTISGGSITSAGITGTNISFSGGGNLNLGVSTTTALTANGTNITSPEVAALSGVTSAIQTQLDSKPTVKMQSGSATVPSTNDAAISTYSVTFGTAFSTGTTPIVTVTPVRSFSSASGRIQLTLNANASNTGFTVQFINNAGAATTLPFNWIAVGS